MASFAKALPALLKTEGAYVDDPDDPGGETYRGIARRHNPDWAGWIRVDNAKERRGFPASLSRDTVLRKEVARFYKQRYWDVFDGDALGNQAIAAKLFDMSVNLGPGRAVAFLQRALNALNRGGTIYPELSTDGEFGPRTLSALAAYLKKDKPIFLLKALNILQGAHYLDIMARDPVLEKYARGWLTRVQLA